MSDTKAEDLAFLIKTGQVKDTATKATTTKNDEE